MTIEQEIRQSAFKDEYHKLAVNLLYTANWLGARERSILKQYGISMQQYNVLRILRGQGGKPASLMLIRERMLDKESNASRLVDKLCEAGYTDRVECPDDRRRVDITITRKGLKLLDEVTPGIEKAHEILHRMGEKEAKLLNELLDRLRSTDISQHTTN
jgi:DNA-binding MarR family transcriptional regulator